MRLDAALFSDFPHRSTLVLAGLLQVPHVAQRGFAQQSPPKLETAKLFMPIPNSLSPLPPKLGDFHSGHSNELRVNGTIVTAKRRQHAFGSAAVTFKCHTKTHQKNCLCKVSFHLNTSYLR